MTDNMPWYLNQTGVLSAGQSALHPEGGRVMSDEDIPPGTRDLPGKLEKEDVKMEQEHQAHLDRRAAGESELRQTESQRPAIPNQQKIGPPPDAKEYHKHSGAWLGAMAMIGALAAKSGRVSGTAALSAFSGAMKGWQEGNLQAYTEAAEKWQNENKRTIENNRQLLEKYDMVLNDHRMSIDQQLAALQRNAVEDHDDIGYRLTREGNMTAIGQRRDMLWEYTNGEKGIALRAAKVQEPLDKHIADLKEMALHWGPRMEQLESGPYSTAFKQNVKYAVQKFSPPDAGMTGSATSMRLQQMQTSAPAIADAIMTGKQPPILTGMQRGEADAVRTELARRNYDLSKATLEYRTAEKQILSLNGPQMTRYAGLANSVVNSIDRLKENSEKMKLGGMAALNKVELETLVNLKGNTPKGKLAAQYLADVNTVKEEFANLANGGYAPTEPAWTLANQQINGNYGVGALGASLDEVQRLINYRLDAIPNLRTMGPGAPNRYMGGGGGGEARTPAAAAPTSGGEDPLGIR